MSRTNKKTRIKGIPPRVQLQIKDAHTGSYPSKFRTASDNRTGDYKVNYNDNNTMIFTSSIDINSEIVYGALAPQQYIKKDAWQILGGDVSSSLKINTADVLNSTDVDPWFHLDFKDSNVNLRTEIGRVRSIDVTDGRYTSGALPGRQAWRFVSASWQYNTQSLAIDDERFADLFPSQSFTLQMVYYYDQIYDTSENTILMSINALDSVATSSYNHFLCVIRHNSDDINMVWRNDDYLYNAQSTPNFNIGEWNHFAVTYDVISDRSASVTTYMNGEPGSTQTKDRMNSGSLIQSMCLGRFRPYPQSGSFWGSNPGGALDTIKINKGILTSEQIYEEYRRSIAYPVSASFNTIKGVSDHGLLFTPGQTLEPYKDHSNPAVDGKSSNHEFYATGSKIEDIGEGFNQPLWAKTKIEIDLTPSVKHAVSMSAYTGGTGSYAMCYWNKDAKVYEGIGSGKELDGFYWSTPTTNTASNFDADVWKSILDEQPIGFSVGTRKSENVVDLSGHQVNRLLNKANARPITEHGFPYSSKFHATSSNLIQMSDYINRPFLIEKVVFEFSGSYTSNNLYTSSSVSELDSADISGSAVSINTLFVLNQKKNQLWSRNVSQNFKNEAYRRNVLKSTNTSSIDGNPVNNVRDLVTYLQISAINTSNSGSQFMNSAAIQTASLGREYNFIHPSSTTSQGLSAGEWTGDIIISGNVKNSLQHDGAHFYYLDKGEVTTTTTYEACTGGGRNKVTVDNRSYLNTLKRNTAEGTKVLGLDTFESYDENNPYLLNPSDELVFGWQLPIPLAWKAPVSGSERPGQGLGQQLEFDASPSKIIFYGSYVKEGKEYHDTLNQLLVNNNVHEIIGDD